jgi:hypothetical protein
VSTLQHAERSVVARKHAPPCHRRVREGADAAHVGEGRRFIVNRSFRDETRAAARGGGRTIASLERAVQRWMRPTRRITMRSFMRGLIVGLAITACAGCATGAGSSAGADGQASPWDNRIQPCSGGTYNRASGLCVSEGV